VQSFQIPQNVAVFRKHIKLTERVWTCPDCNTNHDRDINAAINIKAFALVKTITGKGLPPFTVILTIVMKQCLSEAM